MFSSMLVKKPSEVSLVSLVVSMLSAYDISSRAAVYVHTVPENVLCILTFIIITFPVVAGFSYIYDDRYLRAYSSIWESFTRGVKTAFQWYLYIPLFSVVFVTAFLIAIWELFTPAPYYNQLGKMWNFTPPFINAKQKNDQDELIAGMKGLISKKAPQSDFLLLMAEWFYGSPAEYYLYADRDFLNLEQEIIIAFGRSSRLGEKIPWQRIVDMSEAMINEIGIINQNLHNEAKRQTRDDWNENFNNWNDNFRYSSYQRSYQESKSDNRSYSNHNEQSNYQKTSQSSGESRMAKHFRILGVSTSATYEEVRSSYRKLMKENHPDRFYNASEAEQKKASVKTQEITAAWEYAKDYFGKK